MSKYDYLHALYQHLTSLSVSERNKIMRQVEKRFRNGENNGENESDITAKLGSPAQLAKKFLNKEEIPYLDIKKFQKEVDRIVEGPKEKVKMEMAKPKSKSSYKTIDLSLEPSVPDTVNTSSVKTTSSKTDAHKKVKTKTVTKETDSKQVSSEKTTSKQATKQPRPTKYDKEPNKSGIQEHRIYTSPEAAKQVQRANHPFHMFLASIGLFLFNIIFILGPFITVWALVIALTAVGFALALAGVLVLLSAVLTVPMAFISVPIVILSHPVLMFCTGFFILGVGGLLSVIMIHAIRLCGYVTSKYVGWNTRVIRGY